MLILDVRQADAYAEGHLTGAAVNVPFGMAIPEALANIPDDVQLYVYLLHRPDRQPDHRAAECCGQICRQRTEWFSTTGFPRPKAMKPM